MIENRKPIMDRSHIYLMQILFVFGITYGSQSMDLTNKHKWIYSIARYIVYLLTIQATKALSVQIYDVVNKRSGFNVQRVLDEVNRTQVLIYAAAIAGLWLNDQKIYAEEFPLVFIAYLIIKYPEVEKKTGATVTYGTGMACSFIEGYLVHIIPSDGAQFVGFQENIKIFEANQGVIFPVKRMFIIITKSLHCPPDLKEFNDKSERQDVARLEACSIGDDECGMLQSLEQVVKDVAGVKNRKYKNSAYKIIRPNKQPVYIAAECATPMHTLYRVIKNRDLYEELADVKVDDIVSDFVNMLQTVLPKSPELRNKCELVYFDDTKDLNLADVLLDRIREIEPNFEEHVNRKY